MRRGFTLIELLIVIAILAILAVAALVVLNPAQILAQARDSQRISDLGSIKSAIALDLATAPSSLAIGAGPVVTVTGATCPFTGPGLCTGVTTNSSAAVNGTGWVLVDLTQASGGSPLAALPLDPISNTTYYYAYKGDATNKVFKLAGVLESTKYSPLMGTDGGNLANYYEVGTGMGL